MKIAKNTYYALTNTKKKFSIFERFSAKVFFKKLPAVYQKH